jgi:hypothetical protein
MLIERGSLECKLTQHACVFLAAFRHRIRLGGLVCVPVVLAEREGETVAETVAETGILLLEDFLFGTLLRRIGTTLSPRTSNGRIGAFRH